jgi:hypothetical protein
MNYLRKNYKLIIVTLVGFFTFFSSVLLLLSLNSTNEREFDSDTWKRGDKAARGSMVKDLQEKKILLDKNQNEVKIVLGEPDQRKENEYIYLVDLGTKFGNENWNYFFRVRFDKQNSKVEETLLTD